MPFPLRAGAGAANGTFGELLQGSLRNDDNQFLVTLPIQKFSRVVFTPNLTCNRVTVTPAHKTKSQQLIQRLVDHYGLRFGGHLKIQSELPEGKGMAGSSADLIASARALESTLGLAIPMELILSLLRTIEPSDGVMYSEFVTFFHRKVKLVRRLGSPSGLKVVAVDEGGQIDTVEYNRRNYLFTDNECTEYTELLQTIERAIRDNDLAALGRVTTRSAMMNQERNPKRYLDRMIEIGEDVRALGVVVTHSGPCLGLLFPDDPGYRIPVEHARTALASLTDNVFVVESLAKAVPVVIGS